MKSISKYILLFILISLVFSTILLFYFGREKTILYFIDITNNIRYETKILNLISSSKFNILLILLSVLNLIFGIFYYKFEIVFSLIVKFLSKFQNSVCCILQRNTIQELLIISIIPFTFSIFLAIYMPISYDEAWTFLNFTQKGIITSLCYYPAPNNHVFFSIITCLSNSIHFIDKTFSLRLPVILSSLATLIITYDFIKRTLNKNVAIVMVTLMSVLFMNIYYSYMARGYSFLFLFFVISCYASFQILKNSSNKYLWLIFTISNVLGFFSIPSFLYPFLTLHVFVLLRLKNVSFLQIYSGGITVILTILVYTPIGVLNGTNALTNNSYVTPISRVLVAQQLPAFFTTTLEELIGFNLGVVLTIIFCSMVYISIFKKEYILFYILFLSAPFILLIIHSVIPFPRTFYYYSFIMSLLVVLPFEKILNKMKDITVFTICFIIQFSFIYNFSIKIKNVESYSLIIDQTISNLKINHKDSIYCNSGLADAYLLYNNLNIEYSNPHYCNLDTLIPKYNNNYYLIDSHLDKTKFAKPLKNNKFFNIYYKETENNLY